MLVKYLRVGESKVVLPSTVSSIKEWVSSAKIGRPMWIADEVRVQESLHRKKKVQN